MKTQTLPNTRNNLEGQILLGAFAALFVACGDDLACTGGAGPFPIHEKV